ncbi:GNAT family N-acetyltransferase [Vibrio mangrovi]|uniref:N-acetyltransferase family protein n=1 Tax=Vibrio mangrovi TaxID=474394 RepID=A0A1Y6IZH7_9VIBR|nr:GNAT family N-acetyltransferase [Vibrio mangrovi]MDW6005334.1 N-acetyltransferase family protein [Vibrio mangrovi]SMS03046.1 Phosphinothricin N-acetyltransferase [Vibrio mangrovi]
MNIRDVCSDDAAAIAEIYNHYIDNTVITFEEEPVAADVIAQRIRKIQQAGLPWLVAESEDGVVLGYAYASLWKERSAYRFTVESSVYLAKDTRGKGVGSTLYRSLLTWLQQRGIRHVMGVVALPNERSVGLHEKLGFMKVGEFKEIGFKFNRPVSVGYWQLELNIA